jgi:Glycoside Hydrolase Family 113
MRSRRLGSTGAAVLAIAVGCLAGVACHGPLRGAAAMETPQAPATVDPTETAVPPTSLEERQRGVSWVAQGEVTARDLEALDAVGVNWIVQTPFGWQDRHDSPEIRLVTSGRVLWGETDEGLKVTTALARERGIHTLLKPHVWLRRGEGKWRSDVAMEDDDAWQAWFASYETFILHYARLAEELGIEALAVGTELRETVRQRPQEWRRLIREVRAVYGGRLTYAANWYREFEEIPFWQNLDFIGVQGYFPLTDKPLEDGEGPTVEELRAGWKAPLEQLRALHRRTGLPVVFTEVGYKSTADAAVEPWRWAPRGAPGATPVDLETQQRCYEAFFEEVWKEPWVAGAYFWKWFPHHSRAGGPEDADFTPQNKPAEKVLARWYLSERSDQS